jgi:transcriptional regulator with XRE-family HTH domain
MTVAQILDRHMVAGRMTVRETSKATRVSPQTIRRILNGDVVPQMATVRQLADGLDLDFDVLWDAARAEDRERSASAAAA